MLRQLVYSESRLKGFRPHDAQEPPRTRPSTNPCARLMVAEEGGRWRMRVPLMQRWLRERG
ncbi:MAG: hypothetical protein H0U97_03775 [Gammaproteobacteria bacterium]|nr:hypothetical protein [Gammaproteobacteria bacterium]